MTETEWLESESPQHMRLHLEETQLGTERRLRLFAVACCRRVERWFVHPCQGLSVDVLERYADGVATAAELRTADEAADEIDVIYHTRDWENETSEFDATEAAYHAARSVAQATSNDPPGEGEPTYYHRLYDVIMHAVEATGHGAVALDPKTGRSLLAQAEERKSLAARLRDVFGNPFRPISCNPAWLTSDVVALARGIYDERAFDRMPILADALQDAGCNNDDVLNHCRDANATHARGCWVVDLVLGKT
jgi:hypothetical protein